MKPLLSIHELTIEIAGQPVCQTLSLEIRRGQAWALLGRNGSGKTTLLHHLAGLESAHQGSLLLNAAPLQEFSARARARSVGLLLQHSSRGFGASVEETVLSGRHPHRATLAWESAKDLEIADQALRDFGLDDLRRRPLTHLSGGELRRVELARLLTQQTPLTMLDEPLNHLDLSHQSTCLEILRRQCVSRDRGLLMAIHDINLAYRSCTHWLILDGDGGWMAGQRETLAEPELLSKAFRHPIERLDTTQGPVFLAALPEIPR